MIGLSINRPIMNGFYGTTQKSPKAKEGKII